MPTPSEPAIPPSPPADEEEDAGSREERGSFASCPPEEERHEREASLQQQQQQHAPRTDSPLPSHQPENQERDDEGEVEAEAMADGVRQQPTPEPEPEARAGASTAVEHEKGEHVEDAGIEIAESPSAVASPEPASELAQSLSTATIDGTPTEADEALYLEFPWDKERAPPTSTTSFLRPGSKFRGTQQSDRQVYDVQVEIKDVDMAESFLCGYLRIQGLTDDHPTLTTFFEGEIIGPKHLFRTSHPSWGSSEKVDYQHWARFPAWRPLAKSAKASPNFTLKNSLQREHLFMRWKEYFLVPDHRVKTITGASFEGFYYICFNQALGTVSGIYFHAKSEKFQQLELRHVEDRGCAGSVEFR